MRPLLAPSALATGSSPCTLFKATSTVGRRRTLATCQRRHTAQSDPGSRSRTGGWQATLRVRRLREQCGGKKGVHALRYTPEQGRPEKDACRRSKRTACFCLGGKDGRPPQPFAVYQRNETLCATLVHGAGDVRRGRPHCSGGALNGAWCGAPSGRVFGGSSLHAKDFLSPPLIRNISKPNRKLPTKYAIMLINNVQ